MVTARHAIGAALAVLVVALRPAPAADAVALRLAVDLLREEAPRQAAVEFRRAALSADDRATAAACHWAAAHAYRRAGERERAHQMLDLAEDAAAGLDAECLLLRADLSLDAGNADEAKFYLNGIAGDAGSDALRSYARFRAARASILEDAPDAARAALPPAGDAADRARRAIDDYRSAPRKHPRLGGVLGIVPGLGYAYSGEYANALRSLILNGLFIYAMVDTGENEQWGAFAAVTFFEITWFTGSIYGGYDAAHRHNRRTRQDCLDAIDHAARCEPNLAALPLVTLHFTF